MSKADNKELEEAIKSMKIKEKIEEYEKRRIKLLQLPSDCARNIGIEDCKEKIELYKELLGDDNIE